MELDWYAVQINSYIEKANVGAPVFHSTRVLDQLRERIRYLHYSLQTEKAYVYWARFFHPLEHYATGRHAPSTRHGGGRSRGFSVNDGQRTLR